MKIEFTSNETGKITLGLGWNTWAWRGLSMDDSAWKKLMDLFVDSRCQWMRLDVRQSDWEPRDARSAGYDFNTPRMKSLYRWLDACEANGIEVIWANYYTSDAWLYGKDPESAWMSRIVQQSLSETGKYPARWPSQDEPADHAHFVESFVEVLGHLINEKKYSCVKQVSLFNEATCDHTFAEHDPWPFYRLLDRLLKKRGLRERIKIVGPDDHNVPPWLWREFMDFPVDVLAFHDYWNYFDADRASAAREISDYHRCVQLAGRSFGDYAQVALAAKALSRQNGSPVAMAITEYGHTGNRAKPLPTGNPQTVFKSILSMKCFLCEILKLGYGGALRWSHWPATRGHIYGPIAPEGVVYDPEGKDGQKIQDALNNGAALVTVPFVYEPARLANTVIRRGDIVVAANTEDTPPGVHWIALENAAGTRKLFIVNLRGEPLELIWRNAPESGAFLTYSGDESNAFVQSSVSAVQSEITVSLPALSVNGLISGNIE